MQKHAAAFLALILLGQADMALASTPQEKLAVLQRVLASEKEDNAKYRAAAQETSAILDKLQADLLKKTAILQQTEQQVLELQDKQNATSQSITAMEGELARQHSKLAQLVMAAARLQRVPPEAMLLRPGEPIDTARTNLLLQRATPEIATQATAIKTDLARLATLKETLAQQEATLARLQDKQRHQQDKLNADIAVRQKGLAAITAQTTASDVKLAKLNDDAKALKAILADLARRPPPKPITPPKRTVASVPDDAPLADQRDDDVPGARPAKSWGQSLLSFFKGHGPSRLPITGKIRTGYNEKLASGARSQGMSITGAPGGVVIAPEGGTIRFAGPFRQYRLLVIIEHAGGYHSLLGGLRDVYTKVGTHVAAGEPIGRLEGDAALANLYYEVRHNGKPIDPRDALRG